MQIVTSAALALFVHFAIAAQAFADHTTRDNVLRDSGLSLILVALVLGAAVLAVAGFTIAVLYWERNDAQAEDPPPDFDRVD